MWTSVHIIRTPPNGILLPRNLLKIVSSIEINSAQTFTASSINKTPSDCNIFNLTGLNFNLTIDNYAVRRGFENKLMSEDNNL